MQKSLFSLLILSLSACAYIMKASPVPTDASFDVSQEEAIIIVYIPRDDNIGLRQVNLASQSFLDTGAHTSLYEETELRMPGYADVPGGYYITTGNAGDYAFVMSSNSDRQQVNINCYSEAANVYKVVKGKINFLSLGHIIGNRQYTADLLHSGALLPFEYQPAAGDDLTSQVERLKTILNSYSNIGGEIVVSPVIGQVSFEEEEIGAFRAAKCPLNDMLQIVER